MNAPQTILPKVMSEYLDKRTITFSDLVTLGCLIVTGEQAAIRLRLGRKLLKKFRSWPHAIWIPGRHSTGEINHNYSQAIFFTESGQRERLSSTTTPEHPNTAIFLPLEKPYAQLNRGSIVYICESFIKAMILWKMGLPAVALNGVSGWSQGGGVLNPALSEGWWSQCEIHAVTLFDSLSSDPKSAGDVKSARRNVISKMSAAHEGLRSSYVELPPPPPELKLKSWGIDDFKFHQGGAELEALLNPDNFYRGDSFTASGCVLELNERYAWVRSVSKAYEFSSGVFHSIAAVRENEAPNRMMVEEKWVGAAEMWRVSPHKLVVDGLCFRPGEDRVVDGRVNLYRGLAVRPIPHSPRVKEYWVDVVMEAFPDGGAYLLDAMAYRVQHPEQRMMLYVFVSGKFGTAKNYTLHPLMSIFGPSHGPTMTVEQYVNKFNSTKTSAVVLMLNEMEKSYAKEVSSGLEAEVKLDSDPASRTRGVEYKGKEIMQIERNCLVIMVSNYDLPFPLGWGDRRCLALRSAEHMAIETPERPHGKKTVEYWAARWSWMLQTGEGEVLDYLQKRDISRFNPESEPVMTDYKKRLMQESGMKFDSWLEGLLVDKAGVLERAGERGVDADLIYCSTEQLMLLYELSTGVHLDNKASAGKTVGRVLGQKSQKVQLKVDTHNVTLQLWFFGKTPEQDNGKIYRSWHDLAAALLVAVQGGV